MMSKVALDRVTSSFGFQAAFNNILQQIENEFSENVLYRKNPLGEPNSMSVDIDMGSHDLLNVGMVSATDFRINGETLTQSLQDTLEEVAAYPAEAKGYRDEALIYKDQAQASALSVADVEEHLDALSAPNGSSLVGFVQSGTGAVARTGQEKLRDFVSVKDFGAHGDGTTDDTNAIQTAIDALWASGGGVLSFPTGTYLIASPILGKRGVFLQGAGAGAWLFPNGGKPANATQIVWGGTYQPSNAMFRFAEDDDFIYATGMDGFYLKGMNNIGKAVHGSSICNSVFTNIVSHLCLDTYYLFDVLDSTVGTYSNSNEMRNLFWGDGASANGFVLAGASDGFSGGCAFNTVTNVRGTINSGDGFYVKHGDDNIFINCAVSMVSPSATGALIRLGGSGITYKRAALGNWFFGFNGGAGVGNPGTIIAEAGTGWPSRGNYVFVTGVDAKPIIDIQQGAELFYTNTAGYSANAAPLSRIPSTIISNGGFDSGAFLLLDGFGTTRPSVIARRTNGSPGTPTTLGNGDPVFALIAQAHLPTTTGDAPVNVCNQIVDILGEPTTTSYTSRWRVQLCKGSTVPTDALIIDSAKTESMRPIKFPTFTVTTVPSASLVGAGTMIYVSNGAAGAPVMAFSDGTSWKRCDTLAAIS
jgi:hypothetical protein